MRIVALGACSAIVCCLLSLPAYADPIQQNRPLFVNDHDGGVMPDQNGDPDFVIDPDGDAMPASALQVQPDQDQDEDGDIAMYQGQDDDVPA